VRRLRGSYRLGPASGGMLLVLVAALVVLIAGPGQDRTPAAVILVLILFLLVLRPGGTKFAMARTLDERGETFAAATRGTSQEPAEHDLDAVRTSERDEQPGGG
jgi:hypothetical protein